MVTRTASEMADAIDPRLRRTENSHGGTSTTPPKEADLIAASDELRLAEISISAWQRKWSDERDAHDNAVAELDAAQAAADVLRAMAWRTMESAPRDGTWILGWAERDEAPYRVSWGKNHNDDFAWCTKFAGFVDGYITHWTPLPLPPAPQEKK